MKGWVAMIANEGTPTPLEVLQPERVAAVGESAPATSSASGPGTVVQRRVRPRRGPVAVAKLRAVRARHTAALAVQAKIKRMPREERRRLLMDAGWREVVPGGSQWRHPRSDCQEQRDVAANCGHIYGEQRAVQYVLDGERAVAVLGRRRSS